MPFKADYGADAGDVLCVDCTHPTLPTITHHRGANNPPGIKPSDTSTGFGVGCKPPHRLRATRISGRARCLNAAACSETARLDPGKAALIGWLRPAKCCRLRISMRRRSAARVVDGSQPT